MCCLTLEEQESRKPASSWNSFDEDSRNLFLGILAFKLVSLEGVQSVHALFDNVFKWILDFYNLIYVFVCMNVSFLHTCWHVEV